MKNKIIYICIVCIGLFSIGCSTDTIETYSSRDNIYFTWADERPDISGSFYNQNIDSLGVSFAFIPTTTTDTIFKIPVSVQGQMSEVDRTVKVSVREESTAQQGVHFDIPDEVVFGANLRFDSIPVTLYRTPDMKNESFTIVLELLANDDFDVNMKDEVTDVLTGEVKYYTVFQLTVNDILETPQYWFEPYLGVFTAKKMTLMSELLGIPLNLYTNLVSLAETQYQGQFMQRYLNEQAAAGNTIYEDDGTPMIMGLYVQ